jgi:hypothetical protein
MLNETKTRFIYTLIYKPKDERDWSKRRRPKAWLNVLVTALGSVLGRHREGDPRGWSTVLVTALGSVLGKHREGDPRGWSTVLVTALGSWGKHREGDPRGWSTVLVTALGSCGKLVFRGLNCLLSLVKATLEGGLWY